MQVKSHLHVALAGLSHLGTDPATEGDDNDGWTLVTRGSPVKPPRLHYNKEQLSRVSRVNNLHKQLGFPSDSSLCSDLAGGKHSYSGLTCADVMLRSVLDGPCPHFLAGRYKQPPAVTSDSPPAVTVGQYVSVDLNILPALSPGGFTQELFAVDEHSGRCHVVGLKSKSTDDIYDGLYNKLIRRQYNASSQFSQTQRNSLPPSHPT